MQKVHYVKICNFKSFGDPPELIELDQNAVLIGPNNSGKTSAIQALAIWSHAVKTWVQNKGNAEAEVSKNDKSDREIRGIGLNRLGIIQVPVQATKFFWRNTQVRKGKKNIEIKISVGIQYQAAIKECTMIFKYFTPEVVFCRPDEATLQEHGLINYASTISFELLYPMSGIETEEPLIQSGRMNVLVGLGQTAQVLRNLCYNVCENDRQKSTKDWNEIVGLMKQIFHIELQEPLLNKARGTIEVTYQQKEIKNKNVLDISLAGRGLQQMLLLIAYLYAHKGTVLLIDEPDAHLEILRQRQVFSILKDLAQRNYSQIIIATHSEVILEEAADNNLIMLINGKAVNLSSKANVKSALRHYGVEHYYKASVKPRVLYVEGSTDIEMLKAFAQLIKHRAAELLNDSLYYYYVQDNEPDSSLQNKLEKARNYVDNHKKHFYAIRSVVPEVKGIAVFDSDGQSKNDEIQPELATVFWKKYELECYFITPANFEAFISDYYAQSFGELWRSSTEQVRIIRQIVGGRLERFMKEIVNGNNKAFDEYQAGSAELKHFIWESVTGNRKMSQFADDVFRDYADHVKQPIMLSKGSYYQMIKYGKPDAVNPEIVEKLDLLVRYLSD